eukprot:TRINITY_DN18264_c0_g1_i1.p1 TRINITY_DN18264_c0_g1~~TRINITY_DN18264_c0_g1_i1.p1  ORF type:complete len:547 (-),score=145.80 TRINITY_DN18264_c0_g1_i1:277-1893(-)
MEDREVDVFDVGTYRQRFGYGEDIAPLERESNLDVEDESINRGFVVNEEGFVGILEGMLEEKYGNDEKKRDNKERNLIMSVTSLTTRRNLEWMAYLAFEHFGFNGVQFFDAPLLSLYSCGSTSGTVLELGAGSSTTITAFEGLVIEAGCNKINLGGNDITRHTQKLIQNHFPHLKISLSTAEHIKRQAKLFIPSQSNNNNNIHSSNDITSSKNSSSVFLLPDGTFLDIPFSLHSQIHEPLFNPSLIPFFPSSTPNIFHLVAKSLQSHSIDTRTCHTPFYLSGGVSSTSNILERIKNNHSSYPTPLFSPIFTHELLPHSAWAGGCIVASFRSYNSNYITPSHYNDGDFRSKFKPPSSDDQILNVGYNNNNYNYNKTDDDKNDNKSKSRIKRDLLMEEAPGELDKGVLTTQYVLFNEDYNLYESVVMPLQFYAKIKILKELINNSNVIDWNKIRSKLHLDLIQDLEQLWNNVPALNYITKKYGVLSQTELCQYCGKPFDVIVCVNNMCSSVEKNKSRGLGQRDHEENVKRWKESVLCVIK